MSSAEVIPMHEPASGEHCELAVQVGARIREFRKRRNLTLKGLGDLIGTTPQTVQRLETANMTVSVEWIEKLASALGVNPVEFFRPDSEREAIRQIRQIADDLDQAHGLPRIATPETTPTSI